jgi:hypothetical protein
VFDLALFFRQGLKHILLTIKCLLIVPNPESALNEEAGKLLLERYDDYCARARDQCYDFGNIFGEKNRRKIWRFDCRSQSYDHEEETDL